MEEEAGRRARFTTPRCVLPSDNGQKLLFTATLTPGSGGEPHVEVALG